MAVYVTGDCHGEWRKLRLFSVQQNLTEDDFIIVCGDFGIWDDSALMLTSALQNSIWRALYSNER